MYWWNIEALKKILATRSLTESEIFPYLMAYIITSSFSLIPILGVPYNQLDVYNGIMAAVVVIAGTYYLYLSNGGKDGQAFLQSFFALGWVVGVRYIVMVFLPFLIVAALFIWPLQGDSVETTWIDVIATTLISAGYFLVLGKHIKDLARLKSGEGQIEGKV